MLLMLITTVEYSLSCIHSSRCSKYMRIRNTIIISQNLVGLYIGIYYNSRLFRKYNLEVTYIFIL